MVGGMIEWVLGRSSMRDFECVRMCGDMILPIVQKRETGSNRVLNGPVLDKVLTDCSYPGQMCHRRPIWGMVASAKSPGARLLKICRK